MATERLLGSNRGNAGDFIGECTVSQSCEPCINSNELKRERFSARIVINVFSICAQIRITCINQAGMT
ncbi:hypothetical protein DPMN_141237 [Dreissena polymorpha]|uniref:Uncharacterized protein n=1 Tax=Dreissena polymorpha TaxID=45954 RepID=A0A9D4G9A5_DREPO|nr:hypothetical protein DPMN_141237 [Dreissena polymorpha]